MSKKPIVRLGHAVFRGKGKGWHLVQEELPTDKSQLELRICKKFVQALRRLGRDLSDPISTSDRPHDCMCKEDKLEVAIQLTEATIPRIAQAQNMREQYASRIRENLTALADRLSGLRIQLQLGDDVRRWPRPDSVKGWKIITSFHDSMVGSVDELAVLSVNHFFPKRWTVVGFRCGYSAIRLAEPSPSVGPSVHHAGGIATFENEMEESLPKAIKRKLDKHYAKSAEYRLFLVVYQTQGGIAYTETELYTRSRKLLGLIDHPFDEVWYFVPLAGDACGCRPVQIWPTNP